MSGHLCRAAVAPGFAWCRPAARSRSIGLRRFISNRLFRNWHFRSPHQQLRRVLFKADDEWPDEPKKRVEEDPDWEQLFYGHQALGHEPTGEGPSLGQSDPPASHAAHGAAAAAASANAAELSQAAEPNEGAQQGERSTPLAAWGLIITLGACWAAAALGDSHRVATMAPHAVACIDAAGAAEAVAAAAAAAATAPQPQGPVAEAALAVSRLRECILARFAYHLQRLGTAHILFKILALSLAALPLVLLFGTLYRQASGLTWRQSFYKVYALLYRVPGIGIKEENNAGSYLIANAVFLSGLFSFAAVLGIVSDEIKSAFKAARSGNYPVRVSNHILLLNWNPQTLAVLRQLASAEGRHPQVPVVILADKDKATMDALVHETLKAKNGGNKLHEVHTRKGSPFKLSDLRKVSAESASIILLMQPEGLSQSSAEAVKASAAMSLAALGTSAAQQRVVVQMPGELPAGGDVLSSVTRTMAAVDGSGAAGAGSTAAAQRGSSGAAAGAAAGLVGSGADLAAAPRNQREYHILQLPDEKVLHRLVAQTSTQPGILTVWNDVLALGALKAQFRCMPVAAELVGRSYAELRRSYAQAVVCGVVDAKGSIRFNPAENQLLGEGSQLIALVRGASAGAAAGRPSWWQAAGGGGAAMDAAAALHAQAAAAAAERLGRGSGYTSRPKHVIVAGWPSSSLHDMMVGLSDFSPAGSTVTIITSQDVDDSIPSRLGHCKFNFIRNAHPASVQAMLSAGIKTADTVVLGEQPVGTSDAESDAHVLAALLQVQDAVLGCKRASAPHVVATIKRPATNKLARQYLAMLGRERRASAASEADAEAAARPILQPPEFLNANDVISALLTQVAEEPAYANMIRELLFSDKGQELYLRNPRLFNIPAGVPISFAEVSETVRLTGQTALGLMRGDSGVAVLAPQAGDLLIFGELDRIVVLAEQF